MAPVQYMKETSNNSKKSVLCLQDQSALGAMSEVDSPEQDSIWARFLGSMHPIVSGACKRQRRFLSFEVLWNWQSLGRTLIPNMLGISSAESVRESHSSFDLGASVPDILAVPAESADLPQTVSEGSPGSPEAAVQPANSSTNATVSTGAKVSTGAAGSVTITTEDGKVIKTKTTITKTFSKVAAGIKHFATQDCQTALLWTNTVTVTKKKTVGPCWLLMTL